MAAEEAGIRCRERLFHIGRCLNQSTMHAILEKVSGGDWTLRIYSQAGTSTVLPVTELVAQTRAEYVAAETVIRGN